MTGIELGAVSANPGIALSDMAIGIAPRRSDGREGRDLAEFGSDSLLDHDAFVFRAAESPAIRAGLSDARAWAEDDQSAGALGRAAISVTLTAAPVAVAQAAQASLFADSFVADLTAQAESALALLTSYTSGQGGLGVVSAYNITVNFAGAWTDDLQMRFVLAAEYLSSLIVGDLPDRGDVDDIVISATLSDIDGAGGVLGQAGPTNFRLGTWLPTNGIMEFDVADAETFDGQGLFDDIVIHEMLHTLGFGTIWELQGLTTGSIGRDNMRFIGENAKIALKALFPDIWDDMPRRKRGVAVETDGGSGTAGGHWDEETFGNELMTGYINNDNYVSGVTVAALEDMGYDTVFDRSNPTASVLQPDDLLLS